MEIVDEGSRPVEEPKPSEPLKVGDRVWYVPHEAHAFEAHSGDHPQAGVYPWAMGQRKTRIVNNEHVDEVEEKTGEALKRFLHEIASHPDRATKRRELVFIRPQVLWLATVTAVVEDAKLGTVYAVDIRATGGVTLHYKVPMDELKTAHSCHRAAGVLA